MKSGEPKLQVNGSRESVGDGRPVFDMRNERRRACVGCIAFQGDFHAHIGKANRLFANVASAPDGTNV